MHQVSRDNHFVPQLYLKRWSEDGNQIWSYRTLVPHASVPKWSLRSIRGVAFHRDLYTTHSNGQIMDEFEQWMEAEFETPAGEALDKLKCDRKLEKTDWERLALFLAAQDVRTPTNYLESMKRWKQELPATLNDALRAGVEELERTHPEGSVMEETDTETPFFRNSFKVQVVPNAYPEEDKGLIRADVVAGRSLWLDSQRYLLTKTAKVLKEHKWGIAEPAVGYHWFTTDHPVVRLNYYGDGNYDLKGGWGNQGANLLMPLSPRHLLFTQIGDEVEDRFILSTEKTLEFQSFIAERALRWIFACKPTSRVTQLRPRHVDVLAFKAEDEQWKAWHKEQSAGEF